MITLLHRDLALHLSRERLTLSGQLVMADITSPGCQGYDRIRAGVRLAVFLFFTR